MPNRDRSNRGPMVDIISMAQHDSPSGIGHSEFWRAQLKSWSSGPVIARPLSPDSNDMIAPSEVVPGQARNRAMIAGGMPTATDASKNRCNPGRGAGRHPFAPRRSRAAWHRRSVSEAKQGSVAGTGDGFAGFLVSSDRLSTGRTPTLEVRAATG